MNELIETMFYDFLTGSKEVTELYESREALDVEAMRAAFYAGYAAAQKVQRVKVLYALRQRQRAQATV